MKRRNFIANISGLAAGMLAEKALAICPPQNLSVVGGSMSSPSAVCAGSSTLEADWLARSTGPGVVWIHDFKNAAEVDNFRWRGGKGDDPANTGDGSVRYVANDGITPGCLEIYTAAGTQAACCWWRPFSPITGSGNGRGVNDPGANGSIPVKSYTPATGYGSSNINSWEGGFYGHSSYHSAGGFDGTEFYMQVRVKISGSRYAAGNAEAGKLLYFSHTYRSLTGQEIVTQNNINRDFMAYRSGSPPLEPSKQFGSELSTYWKWPNDEWVTVLFHVVPGREGVNESIFQVWVARAGVKTYTRIWDTRIFPLYYHYNNGQNALILSSYMNGVNSPTAWYIRFDQIIFSKQHIPCPQV